VFVLDSEHSNPRLQELFVVSYPKFLYPRETTTNIYGFESCEIGIAANHPEER
jgi:hypothetical protein